MNSTAAERSLVSELVGRLEIRMLGLVLVLGIALSILYRRGFSRPVS
jgi:hypothetical protein